MFKRKRTQAENSIIIVAVTLITGFLLTSLVFLILKLFRKPAPSPIQDVDALIEKTHAEIESMINALSEELEAKIQANIPPVSSEKK